MAHKIKKRKPPKAAVSDPDLWLYILILLLCSGIVWMLVQKPKVREKPVQETVSDSQAFDPDQLLKALEQSFNLEAGSLVFKDAGGILRLEIPVNRSKMDLTYANLLVSHQFRSMKARQTEGKVDGSRQILGFSSGEQSYEVRLAYEVFDSDRQLGKKYLAIVIDDFGTVSGADLEQWLALPTQITFAIISTLKNSSQTMNLAHQQGRESLVHVPMEPIDYPQQNPGENPILVQMNQAQVEKALLKHVNALPLCMGVNNHMGSLATSDDTIMGWVMDVLKKKNKGFLDSRTSNVSIAYQAAQKARIPAWRNDIFLDSPDITDQNLERKLEAIQTMSAGKNTVVAITHCHNLDKLTYLKKFLERAQGMGFTLIPLSQVGKTDITPII